MKIFAKRRSFRLEFKRQLRLAIMAAIGFTIAFAWREAIFATFQDFVSRFLDVSPEHYLSQTYTAITITLAGVLLIFFTSKILRDK
ncbi:MAG: DUF5654 family protein [Nanoarchaeota archaeon]